MNPRTCAEDTCDSSIRCSWLKRWPLSSWSHRLVTNRTNDVARLPTRKTCIEVPHRGAGYRLLNPSRDHSGFVSISTWMSLLLKHVVQARYLKLKLKINLYGLQIALIPFILILVVMRLTGLVEVIGSHYHISIGWQVDIVAMSPISLWVLHPPSWGFLLLERLLIFDS